MIIVNFEKFNVILLGLAIGIIGAGIYLLRRKINNKPKDNRNEHDD